MSQQETKDMAKHFYRASAADFMKIPGSPVAYWADESIYHAFSNPKLGESYAARQGIATSDNERFLRYWWEVSVDNFEIGCMSKNDTKKTQKKWFPYNKGGSFRKWYGNNEIVINWHSNGEDIKNFDRAVIRNPNYFFKPSVTWTRVSSSYFGVRQSPAGFLFDATGPSVFPKHEDLNFITALLCSKVTSVFLRFMSPNLDFQVGHVVNIPLPCTKKGFDESISNELIEISKLDWDSKETSWEFFETPIVSFKKDLLRSCFDSMAKDNAVKINKYKCLEECNNKFFANCFGFFDDDLVEVSKNQITLAINPDYSFGTIGLDSNELWQSGYLAEVISYTVGCMMGRYSLEKSGLILASQGETLQNYLDQVPSPSFAPDENAILPLTDQEWFPDDATNRFREFICTVWGEEHLQENLDFVAESLCLHAIKAKRGESALDIIRRYLSTQFYKDHLRTYKKRPIYWLFSSGKHKAFECLVYLHRYNESTLARMRTEYVIPLSGKLNAYADKLEQDIDASTSTAETKRLEKEVATLHKQQTELAEFDEKLRHYADQRISLDLDDGVKVNYGKFGDLLAEVKAVMGQK